MIKIRAREPVILASDFHALVAWYRDVLGFRVVNLFEGAFNYASLESSRAMKIGIGEAAEGGPKPEDRARNPVVLQFEVDDVEVLFDHLKQSGVSILGGPSFDKAAGFWFGSFADPEGNPCWVVDKNCP